MSTQNEQTECKEKRAAIYARVSSQKQKQGDTIDSQVEALHAYAKREGYTIPNQWVFLDNGVSGGMLQRPALDELRDVALAEPLHAVLIYAPDRLSRKYSHQLILLEEFRRNGVKICFLKEAPVSNTPEAIMFNHFQGIFAEYERALIIDRSRRGRIHKAKQGDPGILPKVPYGYRKIKSGHQWSVEVIETHAKIVKEIFRLFVYDKKPQSQISKILSQDGVKSPKGLPTWDPSTIRDILNNPAYTGTAYFGKTEKGEGVPDIIRHYGSGKFIKPKWPKKKLPPESWLPISVPQIISESDFELAQEQLNKNKQLASRNTKYPALLQGLVVCGVCGNRFYKRSRKYKETTKGYYYCESNSHRHLQKCSNGWARQIELDDLVYKEVIKLVQDPSILRDELSRRSKESLGQGDAEMRLTVLKKDLVKVSKERDKLLDAFQEGVINLADLKQRNEGLDKRLAVLEKEIKAIEASRIKREQGYDIEQIFECILERLKTSADSLSLQEKQKLVRLLVEEVVVGPGNVKIVHCVSPRAISREFGQLTRDGLG